MPQHVRMSVGQACAFGRALDHLRDVGPGHWPAPFAAERECAVGLAAQLTERSQLIALDRMDRRDSALQSPDMQMRAGEVDLIPFARWRPSCLMPLTIDLSACGDQYFQHDTQLWKVLKLFVCSIVNVV